mgnify:CR=1 FL=1
MKKLNKFKVTELDCKDVYKTNGGTLAYDIGWTIYWSIRSGGGQNVPELINAVGVYGAHYAQ